MKRACIAIVDATRARIYMYDRTADPGDARAAFVGALDEAIDLVNPGRRSHGLVSTNAGEIDRRFACQVVDEIDRISREPGFDRVLLVATPAMLGELRGADGALRRPELIVEYVARDLARLTSPQIHDHLAQLRLVAPRRASVSPG